MRFVFVLAATAVMAAVFAGSALALAFDDADYYWPTGEVGSTYVKQLLGRTDGGYCGNKCKFSIIGGELPKGVTLGSDGLVTGKPEAMGTYRFWIRLAGVYGGTPAEREFELVVNRIRVQVTAPATLPVASPGKPYNVGLKGQGTGQLAWSLASGKLPAGVTLAANGVISGTPTEKGSFLFAARLVDVNDPNRADTKSYELNVLDPLAFSVPAARVGEVGRPFSAIVKATGGKQPYSLSAEQLPDGLAFDAATGVLSGTPTTAGSYTIKLTLRDAFATQSAKELKLRIVAPLAISTTTLRALSVGRDYALRLTTTGGLRPLKWRVLAGKLPAGLRLDARTGALVGTPTAAGRASFTVRVRDALGATSTQRLSLTVRG